MRDLVVESRIPDLLEWLAKGNRDYQQTIEAWRTCCPKLPLREDAMDRGLIFFDVVQGISVVRATTEGLWVARTAPPLKDLTLRKPLGSAIGCAGSAEYQVFAER